MQARCAKLVALDVKLQCKLYDVLVRPVLSYGCEVWMPLISASGMNKLKKVQLSVLCRLLGVPCTAATKHIYAETRRLPDSTFGWQRSLRYMHHLTVLDDNHLVHRTFTANFVQDLGWGQAVRARHSPLGITLPHGTHFDPEVGCVALATAAETALVTPNTDSNLDHLYYSISIKADFQMEPYMDTLHQGPLRTT